MCQLIYIGLANFEMAVLKDDSMEVHYTGSYQMHPNRSSCLGSSANGLMVGHIHEDSCLAFCKTRFPYGLPELHERICIGLPELHRRYRIDPPKWFIQFCIVPPQVSHSIWSL